LNHLPEDTLCYGVHVSSNLIDELQLGTVEIPNVSTEWVLPHDLQSTKSALT
jgi:hypothetical protein